MGKEDFKEELRCCINFPGCTTRSEIFRRRISKNTSVKKKQTGKTVSHAAASMTDYHLGVVAKIKEVAHKEMLFTHCIIHLEHLGAKKLI